MQKKSISSNQNIFDSIHLEPSKQTIQNILQFAASYRVERIQDNQFVDIYLS